jgi:7-carboxy-7-deazaguanine synthase
VEGFYMTYQVKEIFYTLQGEGANAGRPAVFCRFAGCNLWSGREQDRPNAICRFCDTDFVGVDGSGGGRFATSHLLAAAVARQWPQGADARLVVFTGGEPLLQVDADLVNALHMQGFEIAVETNGTLKPPSGIDWVCVSPKAGSDWILREGQELKLVWPQPGFDLRDILDLRFSHYFLQPMDNAQLAENTAACVAECMALPPWRLSVQTHKIVGIR